MKRPITLGTIFLITLAVYLVSAFFMYINEYSYHEFYYNTNLGGVYFYSAAFGYIILLITIPLSLIYLIVEKRMPEFLVRIWNYPIIK